MERVELPMEPVEPRIANFFTILFSQTRGWRRGEGRHFFESAKGLDFQPALGGVRGPARSLWGVDDDVCGVAA